MGQQFLTMGMSGVEGFVPIDSELFISATKAQVLHQLFRAGRSIVAKRYWMALNQTKPQMVEDMIRRAQRAGIEANYLLADAWFGTKPMIRLVGEYLLTPILRMNKNTMKNRLAERLRGVLPIWRRMLIPSISPAFTASGRKSRTTVPGRSDG